MKIYGLTGNIGSGKSTVARMLRELGAFTLDADEVAREIVSPGEPALAEIVAGFGREILREDGTLDREALAEVVFADERERARLNRITHPRILERIKERISTRDDEQQMVFVEASLIDRKSGGLNDLIDGLVVVTCPGELRERRVAERDGMSPEEIRRRMDSQMSEAEKASQADFLIENSSDMENLGAQVCALFEALCAVES
ncbi:MAG: dephospho-CoA kinase [Candidatus Dadabacteria bacterium]|nr:dephospho-CoA kinase [Candidatus Dadabacteria bacterium]MYC40739.1 dephospho-CoA kinase [Candidatus Dadabacteria bacterium]